MHADTPQQEQGTPHEATGTTVAGVWVHTTVHVRLPLVHISEQIARVQYFPPSRRGLTLATTKLEICKRLKLILRIFPNHLFWLINLVIRINTCLINILNYHWI